MKAKLTKHNAALFIDKSRRPKGDTVTALNTVAYTDCKQLLDECREMYDRLRSFRMQAQRTIDYVYGRQWSDRIQDPESPYFGDTITEENYIKRQGKVPLKYNIMHKSLACVSGLFQQSKREPRAVAHDRDEQKLSEMMTIAMQYAYDVNHIYQINANVLRQAYCTGLFCRSVYWSMNDERQKRDVFVQAENPMKMFWNNNVHDVLLRDITTIGAIRDMTQEELVGTFAHNSADARALMQEYATTPRNMTGQFDTFSREQGTQESDFYTPATGLYRVYEVWRKETRRAWYCHDRALGETYYVSTNDEIRNVERINAARKRQMVSLGYDADDANLIEMEDKWELQHYWYVRYLTPTGKCILQGESPFEHGSHPFTISGFPMLAGEIHSPGSALIDVQRGVNRILSQIDFIRQNSAKGLMMVPISAIPEGMSMHEFRTQATKVGNMFFYKPDQFGKNIPQVIHSSSVAAGDLEVIKLYMQLNDEISGVSGALRGEDAKSGTAASLYAQQAQNSAVNQVDFLEWFTTALQMADSKMMKVIQQYYDEKTYIPIVGKNYSEEAKWYDPQKIRNSEFDLHVNESVSTPAYRMAMEDTLVKALEMQAIDFESFLEASSAPFADHLLEIVRRNNRRMQEAQAAEAAMAENAAAQQQLNNELNALQQ